MLARRNWLVIQATMTLCVISLLGTAAHAEWYDELGSDWQVFEWSIQTDGSDALWVADEAIAPGAPGYEYKVEILQVEAQLAGALWIDLTSEFGDTFDEGTRAALPFDPPIYSENVDETTGEGDDEVTLLKLLLTHNVEENTPTSDFRLRTELKDVELGIFLGQQITAFRANAVTGIRDVPEPASWVLLSGGLLFGVGLIRRRRK
jgi:hypothetical protein